MTIKNQKGFSAHYLLIAAIIVSLAGIGWYVWDSQKGSKANYDASTPFDENPKPAQPAKETEEGTLVDMLVLVGAYFPTYQFKSATADLCNAEHWHTEKGKVYGLSSRDSTKVIGMVDPLPGECGFGKISDVKREKITISEAQQKALLEYTVQ